jgi:hypothetical protein
VKKEFLGEWIYFFEFKIERTYVAHYWFSFNVQINFDHAYNRPK